MLFILLVFFIFFSTPVLTSRNVNYDYQLYEDLMYFYNKNVRPVKNSTQPLDVKFGASLIRIIDVDEVNQVLTTSLWLELQWYDYKFVWDPSKFSGIKKLHIPSDLIWIPDIVLYNNADGEPHISIVSDAIIYFNGLVVWKPPSIYKSFCNIEIEYFPFDTQECLMKFGGWTYNGFLMNISQIPVGPDDKPQALSYPDGREYKYLKIGMDLSAYHPSLEWDLMSVSSSRHEQLYPGCCGQDFYIDITFRLVIRRKTLFFIVNLVIPCMLLAILTVFVFYIPACEHKMTYSISVLVTLTVFYLILIELIPPTSMVIPLIGRYLLFTMFLVSFSIAISVVTLNFHRRDGTLHTMPRWIYRLFIRLLPKLLLMNPPEEDAQSENDESTTISDTQAPSFCAGSRRPSPFFVSATIPEGELRLSQLAQMRGLGPDVLRRMLDNVHFIADYFRAKQKRDKASFFPKCPIS
uniref:Uncharacterized protein n=1 Tax=Meloidogyne enterolobii TaxID=390850 RepID=A0A6V7UJF2_MELEN|nr:unnamed protein product [Meloidogyne enterolobii]